MTRNAEATRERILEAATAEFSAYGIAGARVDRIAKNAGCNKNLIYIYFENKETLFTTVLEKHLTRVYEEIVFTPEDLPGFAARVFDFAIANSDLIRLMTWFGMEQQGGNLAGRAAAQHKKVEALRSAQSAGLVGSAFTPEFLMTAVMTLATAWSATNPFASPPGGESAHDPSEARAAVARAVQLLVQGEKQ